MFEDRITDDVLSTVSPERKKFIQERAKQIIASLDEGKKSVWLKFNPDQPRDELGRFTDGGSSSGYDQSILDRFDKTTPPPVIGQPGVWQSRLIPPGQVPAVVAAKTAYIKSKGYEVRDIDYLQIAADPERGKVIADMFDTLPSYDENAIPAYEALRSEVKEQFDYLVNDMGIKVDVVEQDPYKNGSEMMADLEQNNHIAVLSTAVTGGHPFFSNEENDMFRAVHDVFGHAGAGTNFDRNGEEASFISHFQMFSPLAAQALATETRGQNSWLTYSGKDTFAEQKIALLPAVMAQPYPNEGQQNSEALVKSWKFTGDDEGWNEERFGVVNVSLGRYRFNQVAIKGFNPDQPRDELGRFTSGGSVMTAADAADMVYSRAVEIEPAITAMMQETAARNGAVMSGLQFKLKGKDSLERKIAARAAKLPDKSAEKAAAAISDSVRYTMVAPAANYADMANNAVAEFTAQGFECNVKNYWEEGNQYKGINVAMVSPEGDKIELQFHTPESLAVKMEQNHPLYEQARTLEEDSPEFKALDAQMTANSGALIHPPGVESVGRP